MVKYSVYRMAMFLVAVLILLLFRVPPVFAVLFGALFSMVTSFFVLRGPREEAARSIEERLGRAREQRAAKVQAQRTDEDEEDAL